MDEITTQEGLMVFLINLFSEKFPESAILKGGMGLRLLNCPRMTNDIDYMFIPYTSKKDIVPGMCAVLDEVDGLEYEYGLHSTCLRVRVRYGELATQLEINVATACPATGISTAELARQYGLLPRVAAVMDFSVGMAHKLAAWNERLLMRDLYDLYFYYSRLQVMPDAETLDARLNKVRSTRKNKNPRQMTVRQLVDRLRDRLSALAPGDVQEIADYLPPAELAGLDLKLKTHLLGLCDDLDEAAGASDEMRPASRG